MNTLVRPDRKQHHESGAFLFHRVCSLLFTLTGMTAGILIPEILLNTLLLYPRGSKSVSG